MIDHAVDLLITKDSGGEHTVAKLDAAGRARHSGGDHRPARRAGGAAAMTTVDEVLAWISALHPQG